jgi:hypothetical protein
MSTELVRYDAMCQAIAAAYEVDEVRDIRDARVRLSERRIKCPICLTRDGNGLRR